MDIISLCPFSASSDSQREGIIQSLLVEDIHSHEDQLPYDEMIHGSIPVTSTKMRNRQWQVLRHLLLKAGIDGELVYDASGKPSLINGSHISVTHSGNSMILSYGSRAHGVDMEVKGVKASRVKERFCDERELHWAGKVSDDNIYTLIWCAKEAIFKYFGEKVDFRRDIFIEPTELYSPIINGHYKGIHGQRKFICDVLHRHDLWIVHALSEDA